MLFDKVYELSLNIGYVKHWGVVEAARELLQNAIDSDSPFVYEFKGEDSGLQTLTLRSENATLSPQSLLLGTTSKSESESAIGSFGEGYKIALLVLTRSGRKVSIANGDKLWTPSFRYNNKFEEELLIVTEKDLPYKHHGLTFSVSNLTDDDVAAIRASCLAMQAHIGAIHKTSFGDILLEKAGELYVGGLFICKTEMTYGYNIKPMHIKLERDRQTVSSFDLHFTTKEMWFETNQFDTIAQMISEELPDTKYAEYSSTELVKDACYKLFRANNPGAVVAKNQNELKQLVERGMTKVVVVGSSMYTNVSGAKAYKAEKLVALETIEQRLHRWLSQNRSEMRTKAVVSFKELIAESKAWKHV